MLLFPLAPDLQAQQPAYYEISVAGFNIGQMEASQKINADTTIYQLKSEVSFWFFGKIRLEHVTVAKFVKDQFVKSTVTTVTNKGNYLSQVCLVEGKYLVNAHTFKYDLDSTIKEEIHYSSVLLYFKEPVWEEKMLSENFGVIVPITKSEVGHFETLVAGNLNEYFYEDGKLEKVLMQSRIKNYVVRRKK